MEREEAEEKERIAREEREAEDKERARILREVEERRQLVLQRRRERELQEDEELARLEKEAAEPFPLRLSLIHI